MAEHKPEDTTFKVIDRRPFTAEGELRQEAIDEERRETEAAAKRPASKDGAKDGAKTQSAAQAKGTAAASGTGTASATGAATGTAIAPETASEMVSDAASDIAPETAPETEEDATPSSRQFQMLIDFLARNAAAMLGGMADPRTGQPFLDLEGAREMIDMLDVLREKTRGNLSHEDDSLLLEVIGSLKLSFMDISKAAAAAAAGKEKQRGK